MKNPITLALRSLSPRQFECLCAGVLSILDVTTAAITAEKRKQVCAAIRTCERKKFGNEVLANFCDDLLCGNSAEAHATLSAIREEFHLEP
jgi:hypothetical protein